MKAYRIVISHYDGNQEIILEPEIMIDSLNVEDPLGFYLRSLGFEQNLSFFGHYGWQRGDAYANWSLVDYGDDDEED